MKNGNKNGTTAEPNQTPDKGNKGVETEFFKETVHNLPLRCDRSQERTVDGKPYVRSLFRIRELSRKSKALEKSIWTVRTRFLSFRDFATKLVNPRK